MTSRIRERLVLCGPPGAHTDDVADLLTGARWSVTRCSGGESLLAIVCEHRPAAIVYALAHQLAVDLALLSLLRQVAPDLPVVVVTSATHDARVSRPGGMRAVVLEQASADRNRLRHALRAALGRTRQRAPVLVEATG